ncbi:MAG: GerMN domain-containing protein [Patescibacteria group bacterium]
MKKIIIIAIIILAVAGAAVLGARFFSGDDTEIIQNKNIRVTKPTANAVVTSPLQIEGEARLWYFEASFPVKLVDDNGNVLAQGPAQAQSDWMTENFVPFKAELKFNPPTMEKGKLILSKNNPSGLPQNDEQIEVPVVFGKLETAKLKVFFNNDKLDPEYSCNKVFAVEREVAKTEAVARAALEELLAGPSDAEKSSGYFTSINPGVKIQKLTIENGVAKVDFDETLERAVGGSCRVSAIRAEISETLKQFPIVKSVIISIDGRTEDILQP